MTATPTAAIEEWAGPFISAGYPADAIAATSGNCWLESGFKAVAPSRDGSDGGLQWRDAPGVSRLSQMKAWCEKPGIPWNTLKSQALFTIWDLENNYQALKTQLLDPAKSLATKTLDFCDQYEKPAAAGRVPDTRIHYAELALPVIQAMIKIPETPASAPRVPAPGPIPTPQGTANMGSILQALLTQLMTSLISSLAQSAAAAMQSALANMAANPPKIPAVPTAPTSTPPPVTDPLGALLEQFAESLAGKLAAKIPPSTKT